MQVTAEGTKIVDCGFGAGGRAKWTAYGRANAVTVIELAIGPGRVPGMFRVDVVTSAAGEASADVELDADALLARRGLLQQAVLASAVPSRRVLPETEQPVRETGEVLFAGLLGTGEVAGRYRAAAAVAAERGEGLRVVLRIDTPALAGLPWEAMYDQAAGAYVCRQDQLVRHVPVASVPAPLQVRPPLRILGVVSSPRGLPALDVEKEQDQLARALGRAGRPGPGRGALGSEGDLGGPAGPSAGWRVARAALHRARRLRPRPGRGGAGAGARGRARGPGGGAPDRRPAAAGPADAPPGGAELLLRRRGGGE